MDDFIWLKNKLENLGNLGQELLDDNKRTKYNSHTALKLISVNYISDMFTKIARHPDRKKQGFDAAVYIELFAGTGLVEVEDTGDIIAGSAPCAVTSGRGFDYSVLVDKDRESCIALQQRIPKISQDEFDVVRGDVNIVIGDVIKKIKAKFDNPIILAFVDPEGMEIKFRTLKQLSDAFNSCDFLINVNPGAARVAGQIESGMPGRIQTMEEFLDSNVEEILARREAGQSMETQYVVQVKTILGKETGETITIREVGNSVAYYLLCYTRRTSGGSGYSNTYRALKNRIECLDSKRVIKALDQIYGRSGSMDTYFSQDT